ncbi:MAG: HEAT repeat domain-containing protein [Phycisphaerales bacterium]|nr:HEAT repeat domain-containing protein [Phycisphaerales bacterium]
MKSALCLPVLMLLCGGCSSGINTGISDFGSRVADVFTGNTAQVDAARMEDRDFADERRVGINHLVERRYGKGEPYITRYAQIAQNDDSPLVRATAIRALNYARDTSATPLFIQALNDRDPSVRLEAAKALANMPDDKAIEPLVNLMRDPKENEDIRIASADALRHYKRLGVARVLASQLQLRHFGISWQVLRSLETITGADFQYDESAWLQYLASGKSSLG